MCLSSCNHPGGLGQSVTKSNGSLQILQARQTERLQQKKKEKNNWRTQGALSCTLSFSLPFSLCFSLRLYCRTADITFPDFSIFKDCPLILMTMQQRAECCSGQTRISGYTESWRWGMKRKVQSSLKSDTTPHGTRTRGQCETISWHLKSSLLPLFSPPLIFMSVSPSCLVFPRISSVSSLWTQQH